jgi:hypothetical protein
MPRGLIQHRAGREQLGHAVREHSRDQAVLGDGPAAGLPARREPGHLGDEALGRAHAAGRDHHPLETEPLPRVRHAVTLAADQAGGGDADVGEADDRVVVADRVRVGGRAQHAHPGGGQVHQEHEVLAVGRLGLEEAVVGGVVGGHVPLDAIERPLVAAAAAQLFRHVGGVQPELDGPLLVRLGDVVRQAVPELGLDLERDEFVREDPSPRLNVQVIV